MTEPSTDGVAAFIERHQLDAEIIATPDGVPTVERAATALGVTEDQIIKTLVFASPDGNLVIAIANGTGRVDRQKLAVIAGVAKLSFAPPELVLESTGYPPGGVAPVGLPENAPVIVDPSVLEWDEVYGGAGTDLHMMRIRTDDLVRLNRASIAPIVRDSSA